MSQHLHQVGKRHRTGAVDYGSDMVRWLGTDGQRSMERVYPFFAKPSWGLMEDTSGILWIYHRATGYIVAQAEDVRYGKELVTRLHVKLPRFQMSSPPTEKQIGTVIRVKGQQEEKAEKERREAQARGTVQRRGVKDITQYEMFADLPPPRKEKSRKGAWSNAPALYRSLSLLWTDPALSLWAASFLDEDTEAAGWSEAEIEENGYPTRVEVMDMLQIPYRHGGRKLAQGDRWELFLDLASIVGGSRPEGGFSTYVLGEYRFARLYRDTMKGRSAPLIGEGYIIPRWLAVGMIQDLVGPSTMKGSLHVWPVGKEEGFAFIESHHSKLPDRPTRGLKSIVGLFFCPPSTAAEECILAAVATVNTAGAKHAAEYQPHIAEITRIASAGTVRNASSLLAARILDLMAYSNLTLGSPDEPWLLTTYSTIDEEGSTYKALSQRAPWPLLPAAYVEGAPPTGMRKGRTGSLQEVHKIRWEAGPAIEAWGRPQSVEGFTLHGLRLLDRSLREEFKKDPAAWKRRVAKELGEAKRRER